MYKIIAPEVLGRIWLQGIVDGEWDACLSHYDFMCGGELGGGNVEAVEVEGGGIRGFCSEVLEPNSAAGVSCVELPLQCIGLAK